MTGFDFAPVEEVAPEPLMPADAKTTRAGLIHVAEGEIVLTFKWDDELKEAVKEELDGRRWHPYGGRKGGEWRAPLTPSNISAVRRLCASFASFDLTPHAQAALGHDGQNVPTLTYNGKSHLYVHLSYGQGRDEVEPLFGTFDGSNGRWRVPIAAHTVVGLCKLIESGRLVPDDDAAYLIDDQLEESKAELERYRTLGQRSKEASADLEVEGLGGELRPYQAAGVAYSLESRRCFIADQMGLGKTVQALAAVQADDAYPVLIVCPSVVKLNWRREAEKWLPGRRVEIVNGTKQAVGLFRPDVLIVNYDVLHAHVDELMAIGFKALIADESHYVKNADSRRTHALTEIAQSLEPDALRLLLTGTPVLNSPLELISQLNVIDRIADLGGKTYFRNRYTDAKGKVINADELNRRLRATCYVRRKKKDVLTELPDKVRATVLLDVKLGKAYASVRDETIDWLRMHDSDPRTTDAIRQSKLDNVRSEITNAKFGVAVDWIKEFLDGGDDKLVVFAYAISTQDKLVDAFPDAAHVLGRDKPAAREAAVERFQNDPDCRLIICSLKAAGVGITLTAASDVAFVEMGWTSADQDQAEGRCHRMGQHDSVTAWYLLAKDTEDVKIAELIDSKRAMVAAVADGEGVSNNESIVSELTKHLLENGGSE